MIKIDRLTVKYHNKVVGTLSLTPDNKLCAFEYDTTWLVDGFSISPLELPLKQGLFIAKKTPFYGNFGVFEDSLPRGLSKRQWLHYFKPQAKRTKDSEEHPSSRLNTTVFHT